MVEILGSLTKVVETTFYKIMTASAMTLYENNAWMNVEPPQRTMAGLALCASSRLPRCWSICHDF